MRFISNYEAEKALEGRIKALWVKWRSGNFDNKADEPFEGSKELAELVQKKFKGSGCITVKPNTDGTFPYPPMIFRVENRRADYYWIKTLYYGVKRWLK